jgi:plasmid stabilization system protein ParE
MNFTIKIDRDAIRDIEEAIQWYESRQINLGTKFYSLLEEHIQLLSSNPYYQIKYSNVRCLPIKTYPFMIHFTVDENSHTVVIRAVFNTHRDPENWKKRNG